MWEKFNINHQVNANLNFVEHPSHSNENSYYQEG